MFVSEFFSKKLKNIAHAENRSVAWAGPPNLRTIGIWPLFTAQSVIKNSYIIKSSNRNNPYIEKWGSMYYIGT